MCIVCVYIYIYIYMLSKQQLTTDKMYYSIEKTNPSSYRRGGPSLNYVGVIYENKNMVMVPMGPDTKNNHAGECQQATACLFACLYLIHL
jgi:hypothetical protein